MSRRAPKKKSVITKFWPKRHYAWVPYDALFLRVFEAERMGHSFARSWRMALDYARMVAIAEDHRNHCEACMRPAKGAS